ncbi:aminoacyl-histidine dipeptidase [Acinetobacter sp. c2-A9]|uniref:aminoacyl-histidine dipeptidase n=1 Tax=Acinetobacter sp. c2-A9 TaxID=3342802 RepID=UPI0035B94857
MSSLNTLQPTLLWQWFAQICSIPHPSHHEEELAQHIMDWAKQQSFDVSQDSVGNILIRKPATKGMENRQSVALQAHIDMVPQANADTAHDFTKDPILAHVDGEWVKAKGTTLGADNGIGMASMMAILESRDIAHPDLEILITRTEETGMVGAIHLAPNWLKSKILINTDTEEIGEIYIGCAGGIDANLAMPVAWHTASSNTTAINISVKGLSGGHSGIDIHHPKGNAIKLLSRMLQLAQQRVDFNIAQLKGGTLRNAIPREANATILVDAQNTEKLVTLLEQYRKDIITEYVDFESKLKIDIEKASAQEHTSCLDVKTSKHIVNVLYALPNGVNRYSATVEHTVESSVNLGVVTLDQDRVYIQQLVRSLHEEGKQAVCSQIQAIADLANMQMEFDIDYVGWVPDLNSDITQLTQQVYTEILKHPAEYKVIHAGLECGLLKKVYPDVDMVSIGPTIKHAHSPDEKVNIAAVSVYWDLLCSVLARIPEKTA